VLIEAGLPDDPDALRALVVETRAALARRDAEIGRLKTAGGRADVEIRRLHDIIAALQRHRFGARSEKLAEDQLELAFEEIEAALGHVAADPDAASPAPRAAAPRRINRGHLPQHLERIERLIEVEDKACARCGGTLHVVGEDRSERLDVVPATLRVLVTRRPRYGCRSCEGTIVQAPAPARIVEGGIPTEAMVAHVVAAKYADHLPLHRQAQIYARQGVRLDRSTLADWVGRCAWWLRPLRDRLLGELKRSGRLFADETTAPVLDPGRGRTKTGQLWAYARDDRAWGGSDPPAVAYVHAPGRTAERPVEHLAGFRGVRQVDGYAGYRRLSARGDVELAFCWAHLRRGSFEVKESPVAADILARVAKLYAVEDEIRGRSAAARRAARQEKAKPLVEELKCLLQAKLPLLSRKSKLAEAMRHALVRWTGLIRFLDDGRLEIDSNVVERASRPLALTRKNALLAGSDDGGEHWAVIASLVETAKLNGIDPQAWLTRTLERLAAGHPISRVSELMPWRPTPAVA
jgi:transposase